MESPTTHINKRQRASTACSSCRAARKKCHGQSPPCLRCISNSLPCSRSLRKKHKKKEAQTVHPPRRLFCMPQSPLKVIADLELPPRFEFDQVPNESIPTGFDRDAAAENGEMFIKFDLVGRPVPANIEYIHLGSFFLSFTLPIEFTLLDHEALYHLKKEVVFSISGSKNPEWSTLAALIEYGFHNPAVMHLLLAAAVIGLGSKDNTYGIIRSNADKHYVDGKEILARIIRESKKPDHLIIITSFWFWYLYHSKNPGKDRCAYLEMSNQMSEYFQKYDLDRILSVELNPRSSCLARLISWLFWADVAACFKGDGGILARLLIRSSPQAIFKIYESAKPALEYHWGDNYPIVERLDDVKNRSALDLIHLTWVFVQRINEELDSGPLGATKSSEFGKQIEDLLLRKYFYIVELAKSRITLRDRELGNADWAVSNLYALCIYLSRCGISHEADKPILPPEVDKISRNPGYLIEIMDRSLDGSPVGQIDRFQWPLFWAGVGTRDQVHQKWVQKKLISPDYKSALETVLQEQSNMELSIGINRIRQIFCENCGPFSRPSPWAHTRAARE